VEADDLDPTRLARRTYRVGGSEGHQVARCEEAGEARVVPEYFLGDDLRLCPAVIGIDACNHFQPRAVNAALESLQAECAVHVVGQTANQRNSSAGFQQGSHPRARQPASRDVVRSNVGADRQAGAPRSRLIDWAVEVHDGTRDAAQGRNEIGRRDWVDDVAITFGTNERADVCSLTCEVCVARRSSDRGMRSASMRLDSHTLVDRDEERVVESVEDDTDPDRCGLCCSDASEEKHRGNGSKGNRPALHPRPPMRGEQSTYRTSRGPSRTRFFIGTE